MKDGSEKNTRTLKNRLDQQVGWNPLLGSPPLNPCVENVKALVGGQITRICGDCKLAQQL